MKARFLFPIFVALVVGYQAHAATVAITNPSFESGVSGWTGPVGALTTSPPPFNPSYATDGSNVAFLNVSGLGGNQTFYQQISSSILSGNLYTLTFDLGNRADSDALGVLGGDGTNSIEAFFASGSPGGTILGTEFSANLSSVADGTWSQNLTSSFDSTGLSNLNQPLYIVFKSTQTDSTSLISQSLFDNIRVDATPEPSRVLLAFAGVAAIGLRRRRLSRA